MKQEEADYLFEEIVRVDGDWDEYEAYLRKLLDSLVDEE